MRGVAPSALRSQKPPQPPRRRSLSLCPRSSPLASTPSSHIGPWRRRYPATSDGVYDVRKGEVSSTLGTHFLTSSTIRATGLFPAQDTTSWHSFSACPCLLDSGFTTKLLSSTTTSYAGRTASPTIASTDLPLCSRLCFGPREANSELYSSRDWAGESSVRSESVIDRRQVWAVTRPWVLARRALGNKRGATVGPAASGSEC